MTTKAKKRQPVRPSVYPTPTLAFKQSKYNIASMLTSIYGNLGIKQGKKELAEFLRIKDSRTIDKWLSIEAGDSQCINHLLVDKVLSFFNMQEESQLFTEEHKEMLK